MKRCIPVCLALACGDVLAQDPQTNQLVPFATADFGVGKFQEVDIDEDSPPALKGLQDDIESAKHFAFSAGLRGAETGMGLALFYRREWSEGETSTPMPMTEYTVTHTELGVHTNVFGLQGIAILPLSEHLFFRGEVGFGRATATETMDLDIRVLDPDGNYDVSSIGTMEYSGVAFLLGAGIDAMFNRHFGVGAKVGYLRGTVSPESYKITATSGGQSRTQTMDEDDVEDTDISSFGLSAGIRLSM